MKKEIIIFASHASTIDEYEKRREEEKSMIMRMLGERRPDDAEHLCCSCDESFVTTISMLDVIGKMSESAIALGLSDGRLIKKEVVL